MCRQQKRGRGVTQHTQGGQCGLRRERGAEAERRAGAREQQGETGGEGAHDAPEEEVEAAHPREAEAGGGGEEGGREEESRRVQREQVRRVAQPVCAVWATGQPRPHLA